MNEVISNFTAVGLIATIIAIVFAGASLAISYRHKKHQAARHPAAAPHLPVAQPPQHLAPAAPLEATRSFFKSSPATPLAQAPEPATAETGATSSPLFKRLGRVGVVEEPAGGAEKASDNRMDWE